MKHSKFYALFTIVSILISGCVGEVVFGGEDSGGADDKIYGTVESVSSHEIIMDGQSYVVTSDTDFDDYVEVGDFVAIEVDFEDSHWVVEEVDLSSSQESSRPQTSNDGRTLKSGETVHGDMLIFSGGITIEEGARVTRNVIMTSGTLNIDGEIDGGIFLTSGKLNLGETALVHGDIGGTSGEFQQKGGAVVEGDIYSQGSELSGGSNFLSRLIGPVVGIPLGILVVVIYLFSSLRSRPQVASQQAVPSSTSPTHKLKQLQEMKESGLITEAEFEDKKAEIVAIM